MFGYAGHSCPARARREGVSGQEMRQRSATFATPADNTVNLWSQRHALR